MSSPGLRAPRTVRYRRAGKSRDASALCAMESIRSRTFLVSVRRVDRARIGGFMTFLWVSG